MKRPEELFFQEKPARAVLALKELGEGAYQTVVARRIDTTYAHALKVLGELERLKLVRFEQAGRMKLVGLTDLGEEMAETLRRAGRILELAGIAKRIEEVYEREVKGKLRAEIRKERVQQEFERLKSKLEEFFNEPPKLGVIARRLRSRIDECLAEALGLPPESAI